jgi:hypothetical protein
MQSNESIDKLTLELLTNKSQYKKYLSQTNPEKYKQQQEHLDKIAKYRSKIHSMFSNLIENPEKQITNQLNESFDHFVRTCINHFEMKELDYKTSYEKEVEEDDDVLFGNCESNSNSENEHLMDTSYASGSLWGKKIRKKNNDSVDVPSYTSVVVPSYTSVVVPSYTSVAVPSYTSVAGAYTLDMFIKQKRNKK